LSNVYYTTKKNTIYAHLLKWPEDNIVQLNCPIPISDQTMIHIVGLDNDKKQLEWKHILNRSTKTNSNSNMPSASLNIVLPSLTPSIIPCQHAWVISISDVASNWKDVSIEEKL
jgi:Alpha-L-fucosidase C-terminal domain